MTDSSSDSERTRRAEAAEEELLDLVRKAVEELNALGDRLEAYVHQSGEYK